MSDNDPFPRERVTATVRRMPAYLRLSWRLARDPLLGRARRAAVVAAAGYLASPVDLVPGVIPVLGQLDDIAVALAALRFALAGLDPERRREHLSSVGLDDGDLAGDLRTIGAASAWTVRAGGRTTVRAAKGGARVATTGARATGRAASRAAPAARDAATKAVPAARDAATRAVPAARDAAMRAVPAARDAAGRAVPAARDAAAKGVGRVRRLATRGGQVEVTVREVPLPALGPGTPGPAEDPAPDEGRD